VHLAIGKWFQRGGAGEKRDRQKRVWGETVAKKIVLLTVGEGENEKGSIGESIKCTKERSDRGKGGSPKQWIPRPDFGRGRE